MTQEKTKMLVCALLVSFGLFCVTIQYERKDYYSCFHHLNPDLRKQVFLKEINNPCEELK